MERCFRAEADKLAGVRMDRSWLYKEPPISSTCLNIMHTICVYHSVTQSSPTSKKIQAFKKSPCPLCAIHSEVLPPPPRPPPERRNPFQTDKIKFGLCTHLYGFLSQNMYFIVTMQERRWKVEGVQNLMQGKQGHKGRPATPWMGPQRTAAGT